MPGVKAVHLIAKAGTDAPLPRRRHRRRGRRDRGAGARRRPRDQGRLRSLAPCVTEEQALDEKAPQVAKGGNVKKGRAIVKGKPEDELAKADADDRGDLFAASHHPRLPRDARHDREVGGRRQDRRLGKHAGRWPDRGRTGAGVQSSRHECHGVDRGDGGRVRLEVRRRGLGHHRRELSKKAGGRPVKMFLDRIQEHLAAGNRPSATATIKLGAKKDGKLVAMIAESTGPAGSQAAPIPGCPMSTTSRPPRVGHIDVFVNCGDARAMRAPGHPQAARSWKRRWTTWPRSSGSTRSSSGSRTYRPTTSRPRSTRPKSRSGPS